MNEENRGRVKKLLLEVCVCVCWGVWGVWRKLKVQNKELELEL